MAHVLYQRKKRPKPTSMPTKNRQTVFVTFEQSVADLTMGVSASPFTWMVDRSWKRQSAPRGLFSCQVSAINIIMLGMYWSDLVVQIGHRPKVSTDVLLFRDSG